MEKIDRTGMTYYWLTKQHAIHIENEIYGNGNNIKRFCNQIGLHPQTMNKSLNRALDDGRTMISEPVYKLLRKHFPKMGACKKSASIRERKDGKKRRYASTS